MHFVYLIITWTITSFDTDVLLFVRLNHQACCSSDRQAYFPPTARENGLKDKYRMVYIFILQHTFNKTDIIHAV